MSIVSDISCYKRKISKRKIAIKEIKKAISKYEEAYTELEKIQGIVLCDELGRNILKKKKDLNILIQKMNNEISSYNSKIKSLNNQKQQQLNSQNGGN